MSFIYWLHWSLSILLEVVSSQAECSLPAAVFWDVTQCVTSQKTAAKEPKLSVGVNKMTATSLCVFFFFLVWYFFIIIDSSKYIYR